MILSYLRSAARALRRNKLFAAINVCGLAVSLVVAIIVGLMIRADLQWDQCHERAEQIYQVYMPGPTNWQPNPPYDLDYAGLTPNALGPELQASIPGVRKSVRTFGMMATLRYEGVALNEWGQFADPGLFEVFSFPLVQGDARTALSDPGAIVISQRLATKLFGAADAMGKTVFLKPKGEGQSYVVAGVAADAPYASTLQFDWVIPFVHLEQLWERTEPWDLAGMLYLQVDDENAADAVRDWDLAQHVPDHELVLVPLLDLRLHPEVGESGAEVFAIYGVLAGLIVLVAVLNFASLGMSMSYTRAREVGVRKAIGAGRAQVTMQFMGEALLMSYLAVLLAIPLTRAILPGLNRLLTFPGDFDLRLTLEFSPEGIGLLLALGTVVGLLAGVYPALVQSRMRAVQVLRHRPSLLGQGFGRGLVVLQFVVSVSFLATALLVSRQATHWQEGVDVGYDDQNLLAIATLASHRSGDGIHDSHRLLERFRRELRGTADVASIAGVNDFRGGAHTIRLQGADTDVAVDEIIADPGFVRTLGLRLLEGDDLSEDLLAAGSMALVTRSTAALLGGSIVGTILQGQHRPQVVGVVEDFMARRPEEPTKPSVIFVRPQEAIEEVIVRLRPGADEAVLAQIRQAWERAAPDVPFTYEYLRHRSDYHDVTGLILRWLAGFMAFISALGVFGLVSFATVRRTREVGVRKALGATAGNVVWLFGAQFTRLVAIGAVLAGPLAWWFSELLLGGKANRLEFDLISYGGAGAAALALTWLVSAYHMWQASRLNPAYCLRAE